MFRPNILSFKNFWIRILEEKFQGKYSVSNSDITLFWCNTDTDQNKFDHGVWLWRWPNLFFSLPYLCLKLLASCLSTFTLSSLFLFQLKFYFTIYVRGCWFHITVFKSSHISIIHKYGLMTLSFIFFYNHGSLYPTISYCILTHWYYSSWTHVPLQYAPLTTFYWHSSTLVCTVLRFK